MTPSPSELRCFEEQEERTAELLTVDQFAEKLQVSRATVFGWMQRDILIQGKHFFRLGRVLRFPWSTERVDALLQTSAQQLPPQPSPSLSPVVASRKKSKTPINWEY